MHECIKTALKIPTHFLLFLILFKQKIEKTPKISHSYILNLTMSCTSLILSISQLIFMLYKCKQYKKRYSKKRYKMTKQHHITFSILDFFVSVLIYSTTKFKDEMVILIISCTIHFLIIAFINLNCMQADRILIKRSLNKYPIDYGEIRGLVVVNGKDVLQAGEKVQVLDKFNGNILVRKTNGDEYTISVEMININDWG